MIPTTILLTEAGGPAGVSAIKSFRKIPEKIKIVGLDINKSAAGLLLCDKRYVCPKGDQESAYEKFLLDVIEKENINIIIPTGNSGLKITTTLKNRVSCKIYLSDLNTIKICLNKWEFYKKFNKMLPLPITINKKIVKKPISSSGSKNMSFFDCESDYIIQEFVEGIEYTVDVFFDDLGKQFRHIIRERTEIKGGISVKSKIVEDDNISQLIKEITHLIKFCGPINIQIIKEPTGSLKIIEINPRLAGTSIVSTLAGFNFAEYYYNLYYNLPYDILTPIRKISVVRYFEEIVI